MDTCNDTYVEEQLGEEYRNFADKSTNESTSSFIDLSEIAESINKQVLPVISSCIPSKIPNRTDRTLNKILERSRTPLFTNIPRPPPSISSANSIAPSLGVNNRKHSPSSITQTFSKLDSETVYAGAIEALAHSIKQPIQQIDAPTNNSLNNVSDLMDTCMAFVGSILKRFRSKSLQFQIMNRLIEMFINTSTEDLQRTRDN